MNDVIQKCLKWSILLGFWVVLFPILSAHTTPELELQNIPVSGSVEYKSPDYSNELDFIRKQSKAGYPTWAEHIINATFKADGENGWLGQNYLFIDHCDRCANGNNYNWAQNHGMYSTVEGGNEYNSTIHTIPLNPDHELLQNGVAIDYLGNPILISGTYSYYANALIPMWSNITGFDFNSSALIPSSFGIQHDNIGGSIIDDGPTVDGRYDPYSSFKFCEYSKMKSDTVDTTSACQGIREYIAQNTSLSQLIAQGHKFDGTTLINEDAVMNSFNLFNHLSHLHNFETYLADSRIMAKSLGRGYLMYGNYGNLYFPYTLMLGSVADAIWIEKNDSHDITGNVNKQKTLSYTSNTFETLKFKMAEALSKLDGQNKPVMALGRRAQTNFFQGLNAPPEIFEFAEAIATSNGAAFMFNLKNDEMPPVRTDIYELMHKIAEFRYKNPALFEKPYRNKFAEVGFVYSLPTFLNQTYYQTDMFTSPNYYNLFGFSRALEIAHLQYEVVFFGHPEFPMQKLNTNDLLKYKALVIPAGTNLTDEQIILLKNYMDNGGKVFYTASLGTKDAYNKTRNDPTTSGGTLYNYITSQKLIQVLGGANFSGYRGGFFSYSKTESEAVRDILLQNVANPIVKSTPGSIPDTLWINTWIHEKNQNNFLSASFLNYQVQDHFETSCTNWLSKTVTYKNGTTGLDYTCEKYDNGCQTWVNLYGRPAWDTDNDPNTIYTIPPDMVDSWPYGKLCTEMDFTKVRQASITPVNNQTLTLNMPQGIRADIAYWFDPATGTRTTLRNQATNNNECTVTIPQIKVEGILVCGNAASVNNINSILMQERLARKILHAQGKEDKIDNANTPEWEELSISDSTTLTNALNSQIGELDINFAETLIDDYQENNGSILALDFNKNDDTDTIPGSALLKSGWDGLMPNYTYESGTYRTYPEGIRYGWLPFDDDSLPTYEETLYQLHPANGDLISTTECTATLNAGEFLLGTPILLESPFNRTLCSLARYKLKFGFSPGYYKVKMIRTNNSNATNAYRASSMVWANNKAMLLHTAGRAGDYNADTFVAHVSTEDDGLTLAMAEWNVAGLVIYPATEDEYLDEQNKPMMLGGIRNWKISGRFENPDFYPLNQIKTPFTKNGNDVASLGNLQTLSIPTEGYPVVSLGTQNKTSMGDVVYAVANVYADADGVGTFSLGATSWMRLYVNGKLWAYDPNSKGLMKDELKVEVNLKKGNNQIVAELMRYDEREWRFYVSQVKFMEGAVAPEPLILPPPAPPAGGSSTPVKEEAEAARDTSPEQSSRFTGSGCGLKL
ncbi:hypothetical protein K1X76_07370 [bacterium]|nr:hypothetical protein [bacterium]